jgi:two-component system sensor histidine kinase PhoQ
MPRSLRSRLLITATVVLFVFLGLTGIVLDQAFQSSAERGESEKLLVQIYGLLAAAEASESGLYLPNQLQEPGFNQLGSGLYGIVSDDVGNELWRSPSALDLELSDAQVMTIAEAVHTGEQVFGMLQTASGADLFYYSYGILWQNSNSSTAAYVFTTLESTRPVDAEINSFRQNLWLWLGGAVLVLIIVQAFVMSWGLSPLRRLAEDLTLIESGESDYLKGAYPTEIDGVTRNLNLLLANERKQRERYKTTLADLAHSLKTPLAILKGAAGTLDLKGADSKEAGQDGTDDNGLHDDRLTEIMRTIDLQVDRMDQLVSYQLQRSVIASRDSIRKSFAVAPLIENLVVAMNKVYEERKLQFGLFIEDCNFFGDERDLMEIMGNLVDNACKYGNGHVEIRASNSDDSDQLQFRVDDDGPGIPAQNRDQVLQRGMRADTSEPGQGIGLAVVADIVDSYNGEIGITDSPLGGTQIQVLI